MFTSCPSTTEVDNANSLCKPCTTKHKLSPTMDCVDACPANTLLSSVDNTCYPCSGFLKWPDNECVANASDCPDNWYKHPTDKTCIPCTVTNQYFQPRTVDCANNCDKDQYYDSTDYNTCKSCTTGKKVSSNNQCIDKCPQIEKDGSYCIYCLEDTPQKVFDNGKCVTECPTGLKPDFFQNKCLLEAQVMINEMAIMTIGANVDSITGTNEYLTTIFELQRDINTLLDNNSLDDIMKSDNMKKLVEEYTTKMSRQAAEPNVKIFDFVNLALDKQLKLEGNSTKTADQIQEDVDSLKRIINSILRNLFTNAPEILLQSNQSVVYDGEHYAVQFSMDGMDPKTISEAKAKNLSILNYTLCEIHLREQRLIEKNQKVGMLKADFKPQLTVNRSEFLSNSVSFELVLRNGTIIDKELCKNQPIQIATKMKENEKCRYEFIS